MPIRINNITLDIEEDISLIKKKVSKKLKISEKEIKDLKIIKESLDARKKNTIKFNYCVDIEVDNKDEVKIVSKLNDNNVRIEDNSSLEKISFGEKKLSSRPIVIGLGPAGLFSALMLAKNGYKPIVFERGEDVDKRTITVEKFWSNGILDKNSNVQFGEGGAGAFSDGKLTTRIKDRRCDFILEELVKAGAPEEIIYKGKPHVGTDILKGVVKNIRERIKKLGGDIYFSSKLENIIHKDGKIVGIVVNGNEIPCESLVLAIGHSSRDTYEMLHKSGIYMEPKSFAIGVRVEHPRELIDVNQYGKYANHPKLKAAEYRLTHTCKNSGRGVYSFCMCPGGVVVGASSEENRLVVNGMSYHARDKENSNSALVVTVDPNDFTGTSALSGMEFQRHYEKLAFDLGGGGYKAPLQRIDDFIKDRKTKMLGNVNPSIKPGYEFAELKNCLPSYVSESLLEGFCAFDKKIKGFGSGDGIMTGIETRTSAPVRMSRNEILESISLGGLYPTGEGAGFAGGIVSAAVDGIKVAERIMEKYSPLER